MPAPVPAAGVGELAAAAAQRPSPLKRSATAAAGAAEVHGHEELSSEQQQQQQLLQADPAVLALAAALEAQEVPLAQLAQLSAPQLAAVAASWSDMLARAPAAGLGPQHARQDNPLALRNARTLAHAAEARLQGEGFGRQELATLAWFVAHFDREWARRVFEAAMRVPFQVIPHSLPHLRLEDFMAEVALNRDTIKLDNGDGTTKVVPEARLTGWQSDIGATFKYSGKEMVAAAGGLTPCVAQVRDELHKLTGQWFDSVLINYYEDGKCGMRYHVDPLYGVWAPPSAVVSLGDMRAFVFREITDFSIRWQYAVRNGDVVYMYGDCQDRLQHCIKVERRAEDAGPRMSLVFKQRLPGTM